MSAWRPRDDAAHARRCDRAGGPCTAAGRGLAAYGSLSTTTSATTVLNTRGVRRHAALSQCSMITVVRGEDGAGYAARHAASIDDIDAAAVAAEVIDTCERNQHATSIE